MHAKTPACSVGELANRWKPASKPVKNEPNRRTTKGDRALQLKTSANLRSPVRPSVAPRFQRYPQSHHAKAKERDPRPLIIANWPLAKASSRPNANCQLPTDDCQLLLLIPDPHHSNPFIPHSFFNTVIFRQHASSTGSDGEPNCGEGWPPAAKNPTDDTRAGQAELRPVTQVDEVRADGNEKRLETRSEKREARS